MENMKELALACLEAARKEFEAAEVYIEKSASASISYYNGDLDEYEISEEGGLQLTVQKGDKWANVYSEKVTPDAWPDLIEQAKAVLDIAAPKPYKKLYRPSADEEIIPITNRKVQDFHPDQALKTLQEISALTQNRSTETRMIQVSLSREASESILVNTEGLCREQSYALAYVLDYVILARGEDMKSGYSFRLVDDFAVVDQNGLVEEAVRKAEETYGAKSTMPGSYTLVFENEVVGSLFNNMLSSFSADQVQKGLSLLGDKLGQDIASPLVTLTDDPQSPFGFAQKQYDGEGVPAKPLHLIKQGKLEHFLHTLESAAKAETQPTGNAARSYKSTSLPSKSTLVLEPGDKSFDDLLAQVGNGLFITELQGFHSGYDPISGDFSLPASGFLIVDGKKGRPVNQITVAGNMLRLLQDIQCIGSDAKLSLSGVYAPSIIVTGLAVSGDEESGNPQD